MPGLTDGRRCGYMKSDDGRLWMIELYIVLDGGSMMGGCSAVRDGVDRSSWGEEIDG